MNIFALDSDPIKAAQMQADSHIRKMTVESAQMLSTVHRYLDGSLQEVYVPSKKNPEKLRKKKIYLHEQEDLYQVCHLNHPSTVWTRASSENYLWHYRHFCALCDEYTFRYGKVHATDRKLRSILANLPKNIPAGPLTPFALAMKSEPQCMNPSDPVDSYRKFYKTKQVRMKMVWTKRSIPEWFN